MAEQVNARASCASGPEFKIPSWPDLTQHYKRFATASISTQVVVMPWRYDAEMSTTNSLHASVNHEEKSSKLMSSCDRFKS